MVETLCVLKTTVCCVCVCVCVCVCARRARARAFDHLTSESEAIMHVCFANIAALYVLFLGVLSVAYILLFVIVKASFWGFHMNFYSTDLSVGVPG